MPNHCSNNLVVKGSVNYLTGFKRKFLIESEDSSRGASYDIIHTMPKDLKSDVSPLPHKDGETDEQYVNRMQSYRSLYNADNWYDWRVYNWGTKWDVYDLYISDNEDEYFSCSFSSAWSPPIGWFKKAVKMFPNLKFEMDFIEEGCAFCGLAIGTDGIPSVEYSDIQYEDENGKRVEWDSSIDKYVYDDGTSIDDEEFYPIAVNPLTD